MEIISLIHKLVLSTKTTKNFLLFPDFSQIIRYISKRLEVEYTILTALL